MNESDGFRFTYKIYYSKIILSSFNVAAIETTNSDFSIYLRFMKPAQAKSTRQANVAIVASFKTIIENKSYQSIEIYMLTQLSPYTDTNRH